MRLQRAARLDRDPVMAFVDILLYLESYPEPVRPETIEQSVRWCKEIGGHLTGLAVEVSIKAPTNWLADRLVGLGALRASEEGRSADAARSALELFERARGRYGLHGEALACRSSLHLVGKLVAGLARTRDLCLLPILDRRDMYHARSVAEAVVFDSGRPVILFRPESSGLPEGFDRIAVAWDGSRAATRALADAMPLLSRAGHVRIVTVVNEKPEAASGLAGDVARHLRLHGIAAAADEIDARGRPVGEVLAAAVDAGRNDLLVMGAYGHSRAREFILGGATDHLLGAFTTPLLLSR